MAPLARVKDVREFNENLFLNSKIDATTNGIFRNEKLSCDFCERQLTSTRYHQTESRLLLCSACFLHMASLLPTAEKAVERFLLGNVV